MHHLLSRLALSTFLAALPFSAASIAGGQTVAAVQRSARVVTPVNAGQAVRLTGHVPAFADAAQLPSTAIAPSAQFAHLTVVLSRAPAVEAAFEQLLADQVNPSSSRYHQWLTPAQVGALYGPAQSDVDAVTSWLQGKGLTVNSVSPNRLFVDFSGPVSSVEGAFGTTFRMFSLANGEQRYSLMQEPTVPAALQPVIATVAGLSQVIHHSTAKQGTPIGAQSAANASGVVPAYTTGGGNHFLMAGDFNTAYDITPLLSAGTTGSGQNIAVVGQSRVAAADISQLQAMEGQTLKQPNVIIPTSGADPSITNDDAQAEATLDVDRTNGTAPGAIIDLVVSKDIGSGNTYATSGLYIALNYAINTVNDPILSISFGGCEALNGQPNDVYEQSIFQTAASQGITTFVSSGDNGAAACNAFYSTIPTSQQLSINDLCANQYVTCVGGTEFAETSSYWNTTNSSTFTSLLSYPPEGAWNDVDVSSRGVYSQGATGGGVSVYLAKPSWQTGTGVPPGSFRYIPDVAFTSSADHDAFIVCLAYANTACAYSGTSISNAALFGGTSAAAPSMAGIQALVNQKLGGARQGNINPAIYSLGNAGTVFHDVTTATSGVSSCVLSTPSLCNNSTPTSSSTTGGQAGYALTTGYDPVTGWGSLDVAKYIAALSTTSGFSIGAASGTLSTAVGGSQTDALTLTSLNSFAGTASLTCQIFTTSGSSTGSCSLSTSTVTLAAGGTGSTVLTVNAATAAGTLNVLITGVSGSTTEYANVIVTVGATTSPTFSITPASTTLSFTSGATSGNTVSLALASLNSFVGTVSLTCTLTASTAAYQPTCAVSPTSVALTAGGTGAATLTITSTTARSAAQSGGSLTASRGWGLGGGAALALLVFCMPLRKRRRTFGAITLLGLMALGLAAVSGCSDSGTTAIPTMKSSAGTYTVTITGTGTTTGTTTAVSASSTVSVTIN